MLLVLKFEKTGQSALAAHVDTLRAITYIFRRAGVSGEYSQGYNPHMEMNFSPPISLGTESVCEYVSLKFQPSEDILQRLNAVCPSGIRFVDYGFVEDKVNITSAITSAEYLLKAKGIGNCAEEISADGYSITYTDKSGEVTKDVSSRILRAEKVEEDVLKAILTIGNENLRPDRLALHLCKTHGMDDYSVLKIRSFVKDVNADVAFGIKVEN